VLRIMRMKDEADAVAVPPFIAIAKDPQLK
jgi:hypothetical protein